MREINNFYALEGLDGVGKTTIRKNLQSLGYRVLKTPPDSFPFERTFYDGFEPHLRFAFYLMGVVMAGSQASEVAKSGRRVICDRYLLTTVSAHEAMGVKESFINAFRPLIDRIAVPNNTFVLTATEEERVRRMLERGANANDLQNVRINSAILEGYRKWSKKLGHRLMEIDTTYIPSSEVTRLIEGYIKTPNKVEI